MRSNNYLFIIVVVTTTLLLLLANYSNATVFKSDKYFKVESIGKDSYRLTQVNIKNSNQDDVDEYENVGSFRVSSIDFPLEWRQRRVLDEQSILDNPEDLIVKGVFSLHGKSYSFVPSEIYKALPYPEDMTPTDDYDNDQTSAMDGSGFFYFLQAGFPMCRFRTCINAIQAVNVNDPKDKTKLAVFRDLYPTLPGFDGEWYREAVNNKKIMFQLEFERVGAAHVLKAYVKLDPLHDCPMFKMAACPEGQTQVYSRNEDLCLIPDRCVEPNYESCRFDPVPKCVAGYTLHQYVSEPSGCPQYRCDPSFLPCHR
ncbi:hypothetical protein SAMD00019534_070920 [Acytostelium subglobosum LB1]|uniref:hypothetical protein n=1 Tax=Acytostelium subglobosum LB1 TaxID=1410327 RepID=UPI0006447C93|nr:hypothetical protein SAMD00019534_070920 [Acytostelium subglobosum LB1]GAM23917.1 hypothetical protein SAMD00019534_070920 [Acytostelium subglobosum LB1]|eukprot:XP_012752953.1 hypothetical protein SAMD00019534_070920 [Acytostelium subglobosum LB1]